MTNFGSGVQYPLNTKSDQGTFTPVGAQGGSMELPLKKTLSQQNFDTKFAPYMYGL